MLLQSDPPSQFQPPLLLLPLPLVLSLQVLACYLSMWRENGYNITLFMDADAAIMSEFEPEDFFVPASELKTYLDCLQLVVAVHGEGVTSRGNRLIDFIASNNEAVAHGKMTREQGYVCDHDTLCAVYLLPVTGKKG